MRGEYPYVVGSTNIRGITKFYNIKKSMCLMGGGGISNYIAGNKECVVMLTRTSRQSRDKAATLQ